MTMHDEPLQPIDETLALPADDGDGWPAFDLTTVLAMPEDALRRLDEQIEAAGDRVTPDPDREGAAGFTMFDSPGSEDNSVTVLLADGHIADLPSQSLVRIKSKDGRRYLGSVTAGPFAEPDGLRADSHILVTTVTRGGIFVPPYHGRVQVEILGEEREDGARGLVPPRYRPLPNSPVFVLDDRETADVLHADGDIQLGQVVGRDDVTVGIPSDRKDVLPRHTAILGTTGSGKSTSVARLIQQAQAAGCAVILLDVEGEYSFLHEPTEAPGMTAALARRGLAPAGLSRMWLCHLVGRETANPDHPSRAAFSLRFERLSPYAIVELLDLSEAQRHRFLQAYDAATALLRDLRIFPQPGQPEDEQQAMEWDELEAGYPRMELRLLMDVIGGARIVVEKGEKEAFRFGHPALESEDAQKKLFARVGPVVKSDSSPASWRALLGKLATLARLKVFDRGRDEHGQVVMPLNFKKLLQPGAVTVIDLSDTGSPVVSNLVIADLLRGIQEAQDEAYGRFEAARRQGGSEQAPTRALIVIEEAHEFLSAERIEKMPVLFGQVARIARRGRKRWLGLVFVTQLPQHLPRELFGLVNSYVLHKIADPQVVGALKRTVSGIDDSLWRRLPGLAPGQAIVAFPHLARPLLVAMDPAPSKLRLVD
jgi:DNA helicase HerA-like ATPase